MDNSKLEELKKLAQESIREAQDTNALNDVRVRFLGKKGESGKSDSQILYRCRLRCSAFLIDHSNDCCLPIHTVSFQCVMS